MDIACPQCAAAYEIDGATFGAAGRKVRCAACGTVWRAFAVDGPSAFEPEDPAAPERPTAATPAPAPEPPRARWIKDPVGGADGPAAWRRIANWRTGAIAATLVVLAVGLHQRERVVRHLPQTARLYAAAGLPVNLRGIEIRNVQSRIVNDNDESVLVVDGELANVSNRRVDVPRLHLALLGQDGRQVYVWSAQADRAMLQPGEKLGFRRRLAAPPAEAAAVSVRFLTRSDITAGIK